MTPDVNSLLINSKRGDSAAREELFRHLHVRLRMILKYRLRGWPAEDLDDVLQDTLTVVAERLLEIEAYPDIFALHVLRNKIGNRISVRRRRTYVSLHPTGGDDLDAQSDAAVSGLSRAAPAELEHDPAINETAEAVRRAVHLLSPLCQALIVALLERRSVSETWEYFYDADHSLKRSTYDKRLFDCRRKLRQLLPCIARG
jgi:DNA-directed RNA polymerase specialized sigma24 family protein